jgi:hypothetical protein
MKIIVHLPTAKYDFSLDFGFSLIYIGIEIYSKLEEEMHNE